MNRSKLTIEESLEKIKFMMNYNSSKTLTEQVPENTSFAGGQSLSPTAESYKEVNDGYINSIVRKLKRNYDRIDELMKELNSHTYQGRPALEKVQDIYKANYGEDLPGQVDSTLAGTPPEPIDITKPEPLKGPLNNPVKQWPFAKGTEDSKYKYGTQGSGIAQVQQALGLTQDGIWGPKTDAKIKELAPEFANGFTNENMMQVIQKVRGQFNPTANTSNLKPPTNLMPSQNTSQLSGNTTKPRA
jgi:hypothetical protein